MRSTIPCLCLLVSFAGAGQAPRPVRLAGHRDTVLAVAYSPDGRLLASGSLDRTVRLWDVRARRVRATLPAHPKQVSSVAFLRDGKTLATACHDGRVRLWNLATRRETARLATGASAVFQIALSPDGKLLAAATGSEDRPGEVKVWDLGTRQVRATFRHGVLALALAFAPGSQLLASGASDGISATVRLWDLAARKEEFTYRTERNVAAVAFAPNGKLLAAGSLETIPMQGDVGVVHLWDLESGEERPSLRVGHGLVKAVAFSPNGKWLAAGGGSLVAGETRLWALPDTRPAATFPAPNSIDDLAFSPDGQTLAAATSQPGKPFDPPAGLIQLWSLPRPRQADRTGVAAPIP